MQLNVCFDNMLDRLSINAIKLRICNDTGFFAHFKPEDPDFGFNITFCPWCGSKITLKSASENINNG